MIIDFKRFAERVGRMAEILKPYSMPMKDFFHRVAVPAAISAAPEGHGVLLVPGEGLCLAPFEREEWPPWLQGAVLRSRGSSRFVDLTAWQEDFAS